MKIKEYFNTTKNEIDSKKYNIFIPICLGNSFFTDKNSIKENVEKYLNWALEHTKGKVLFIVADKIQCTNYYVRNNHRTEVASLRKVLSEGKEIKENLKKLISKYPKATQEKINVISWEEYEKSDPFWYHTTHLVYKEFKNNKDFMNEVLTAVKTSIVDRTFSDREYLKLCEYVLDEFSLTYSGTEYKNNYYGLYLYPVTDSVVYFIDRIQKGENFVELYKKLPKEKVALGILN